MKLTCAAGVLLAIGLLAHGTARAQTPYQVRPVISVGDTIGDRAIPKHFAVFIEGFNDRGELVVALWDPSGKEGERVYHYADGRFTPILLPGMEGPSGVWPPRVSTYMWASNHRGSVQFTTQEANPGKFMGHYRWDVDSKTVTQVLKMGMPAGDLGKVWSAPYVPALNNHNEMVVPVWIATSNRTIAGNGIYFVAPDGTWQSVLQPRQELPGGGIVLEEWPHPHSVNDAGVVAFLARRKGDAQYSAFLWEQGRLSTLLTVGTDAPGGGKFTAVSDVQVSNASRDVIVAAAVDNRWNHGLYRIVGDQVIPVAVPRQAMPGGGTFLAISYTGGLWGGTVHVGEGLGRPNMRGELAFTATLTDGAQAIYKMTADGSMTPIVKLRQVTDQGRITELDSPRPILNSQGEVAVRLRINNGPRTVAILTPGVP